MKELRTVEKASLLDSYLSDPHISKMIDIAKVQSELMKLGCYLEPNNKRHNINVLYLPCQIKDIVFWGEMVSFRDERYYYTSPTWQTDLINEVNKWLNNHNSYI